VCGWRGQHLHRAVLEVGGQFVTVLPPYGTAYQHEGYGGTGGVVNAASERNLPVTAAWPVVESTHSSPEPTGAHPA
jgi:hypothetical protein